MSPRRPAPQAGGPPDASWPCVSGGVGGAEGLGRTAQPTRLQVAVTPGARRTGTDGLHDGALRVRVLAPPVDGKANAALVGWLAGELGLPQRAVRVVRGLTARRKQIEIDAPLGLVADWLTLSLGGPGPEAASATPQTPPTP